MLGNRRPGPRKACMTDLIYLIWSDRPNPLLLSAPAEPRLVRSRPPATDPHGIWRSNPLNSFVHVFEIRRGKL